MKSATNFRTVYLHRDYIDMRKGILSLCELVVNEGLGDLMGNNLFVFCGKRRRRIKILYYDVNGFALWQKVLQQDTYFWPRKIDTEVVCLTPQELGWLLDGLDVTRMKPFKKINYEAFC